MSSLAAKFAIGCGASFTTGMLGYLTRVGISQSENFDAHNMLIEGGFNIISGALSFAGGALGGYAGLHSTPFKAGLPVQGGLLARIFVENVFILGGKLIGPIVKGRFMN